MEMEDEDEKLVKTNVVVDKGVIHVTWKMNGSKMSEEYHHLRAPNDSQDKIRRRRTSVTKKPTQFEESNLSFKFNINYFCVQ